MIAPERLKAMITLLGHEEMTPTATRMLLSLCEGEGESITVPRSLIEELVDPDDCHYDHHGYCQAHNLHERPCPHETAKDLLNE